MIGWGVGGNGRGGGLRAYYQLPTAKKFRNPQEAACSRLGTDTLCPEHYQYLVGTWAPQMLDIQCCLQQSPGQCAYEMIGHRQRTRNTHRKGICQERRTAPVSIAVHNGDGHTANAKCPPPPHEAARDQDKEVHALSKEAHTGKPMGRDTAQATTSQTVERGQHGPTPTTRGTTPGVRGWGASRGP